jgi:hypothetical protein
MSSWLITRDKIEKICDTDSWHGARLLDVGANAHIERTQWITECPRFGSARMRVAQSFGKRAANHPSLPSSRVLYPPLSQKAPTGSLTFRNGLADPAQLPDQ